MFRGTGNLEQDVQSFFYGAWGITFFSLGIAVGGGVLPAATTTVGEWGIAGWNTFQSGYTWVSSTGLYAIQRGYAWVNSYGYVYSSRLLTNLSTTSNIVYNTLKYRYLMRAYTINDVMYGYGSGYGVVDYTPSTWQGWTAFGMGLISPK